MTITIVKFEKAVVVQFVGMIEELRGGGEIFYHEGFMLKSIGGTDIFWDVLCFPGKNTSDDGLGDCLRFKSNEERDEWFTKCTNCLKAWKESRQSEDPALLDVWTMEVD